MNNRKKIIHSTVLISPTDRKYVVYIDNNKLNHLTTDDIEPELDAQDKRIYYIFNSANDKIKLQTITNYNKNTRCMKNNKDKQIRREEIALPLNLQSIPGNKLIYIDLATKKILTGSQLNQSLAPASNSNATNANDSQGLGKRKWEDDELDAAIGLFSFF